MNINIGAYPLILTVSYRESIMMNDGIQWHIISAKWWSLTIIRDSSDIKEILATEYRLYNFKCKHSHLLSWYSFYQRGEGGLILFFTCISFVRFNKILMSVVPLFCYLFLFLLQYLSSLHLTNFPYLRFPTILFQPTYLPNCALCLSVTIFHIVFTSSFFKRKY